MSIVFQELVSQQQMPESTTAEQLSSYLEADTVRNDLLYNGAGDLSAAAQPSGAREPPHVHLIFRIMRLISLSHIPD
jgi:hypothetical protein